MVPDDDKRIDQPEAAMNAVLEAEAEAKAAIADCEAQAAALVEEARRQARRIAERADERISRVHAECAEKTGRAVESTLREEPAGQAEPFGQPLEHEQEVLAAAVARLAALLTEEAPDTPAGAP
jgi:vacuolar-type H+-ATPase subunit H